MGTTKTVRKITGWNPTGMSSTGCPKSRWKDEARNNLKKLKVENWTRLVGDRKAWYVLVQKAKTHSNSSWKRRKKKKCCAKKQ
jgi:hypothetical protein